MLLQYLLPAVLVSCARLSTLAFVANSWGSFRRSTILHANDEQQIIRSFSELGLSPEALNAVQAQTGWSGPTPVQRLVIPQLLKLRNAAADDTRNDEHHPPHSVWCESPTGSGKTAAYALPLLQHLRKARRIAHGTGNDYIEGGRVSSLILCPTRELAAQIGSVVRNLDKHMASSLGNRGRPRPLNIMSIYGGTRMEPQISELADIVRNGSTLDVLIATPGRLVDVLTYYSNSESPETATEATLEQRLLQALDKQQRSSHSIDNSLSLQKLEELQLHKDQISDDGRNGLQHLLRDLRILVVDEADRLLGQGFQCELDAVLELLPDKVATWLFSATFPKQIEPRVDHVLKRTGTASPIRISCTNSNRVRESEDSVSSSLQKKLERVIVAKSQVEQQTVGSASTIQLRTIRIEKPLRTQALRYLLLEENPQWDRVLVFVSTRYASGHVSRKLRRAGISSAELHGKLDQDARTRRLNDLKDGKIRVLLATDVASRGLDIVGLPAVVNYDLPRSTADFVHRVGRTGRAGRPGTAISFVTPMTEAHYDIIEQRHVPHQIDREVLPGFEPDEEKWKVESAASHISVPGTSHSTNGLAHDRMFGGIKGRRKSKKDKLREQAARDQSPTMDRLS